MEVNGYVAPGFEQVAEEFSRNFTVRDDLGASFAVMRDDEPLVDLWGGIADRASARAWTADTLQILFSGTKGLVAACVLLLMERGQLGTGIAGRAVLAGVRGRGQVGRARPGPRHAHGRPARTGRSCDLARGD